MKDNKETTDQFINLCDSCVHNYPSCPSKTDDVVFGSGFGDDNIIECKCYKEVQNATSN